MESQLTDGNFQALVDAAKNMLQHDTAANRREKLWPCHEAMALHDALSASRPEAVVAVIAIARQVADKAEATLDDELLDRSWKGCTGGRHTEAQCPSCTAWTTLSNRRGALAERLKALRAALAKLEVQP